MLAEEGFAQDMSLGSDLQDWLSHMRSRVRATTYEGYLALVRHHALPHLGEVPLAELHPCRSSASMRACWSRGRTPGAARFRPRPWGTCTGITALVRLPD